ncbi:hypothetical protein [Seonamhaeicola sp. ML3]|uniref:hypothetical protein n=1 Tax=Seonamhaeicola sp. ML3 TaxID=2937786 RepID=UPI00200C73BC|nr:hypothetical protein [Seonamhaeicola sp. ML3]
MKKNITTLLVCFSLVFVTSGFAQRGNYRITNGFSVAGGISQFNIATDNFITDQGSGFAGGFLSTVDIPHKWYNISFGIQFSENSIGISARPSQSAPSTPNEFIDYKLFAAQFAFLVNAKVIEDHFTIDFGPMLQYNSRLELKDNTQENYVINNYTNLTATDIADISRFNINGAIGASLGIKHFKLRAQYVYGFTNIFNKLESSNLDTSGGDARLKGNTNMLVLGVIASF